MTQCLALFGWVADQTKSRRLPWLVGLVSLAATTFLLWIGKTAALLLVGRLLQGFAAAIVWTVGLALLVDTVSKENIAQFMGFVSLSSNLALLSAPLLAGIIYDRGGYNAVFAMAFSLLGLDILLRLLMIEKRDAEQYLEPEDEQARDPLLSPELTGRRGNEVDSHEAQNRGNRSAPQLIEPSMAGLQKPTRLCTLPPLVRLLKSGRLLSALWCSLVYAAIVSSFESVCHLPLNSISTDSSLKVLPLYVNKTFGWKSTGAGLVLLATAAPTFLGPLVGRAPFQS